MSKERHLIKSYNQTTGLKINSTSVDELNIAYSSWVFIAQTVFGFSFLGLILVLIAVDVMDKHQLEFIILSTVFGILMLLIAIQKKKSKKVLLTKETFLVKGEIIKWSNVDTIEHINEVSRQAPRYNIELISVELKDKRKIEFSLMEINHSKNDVINFMLKHAFITDDTN